MSGHSVFVVKKGVPIKRARAVYPFEAMDVGDCFDAPDDMGVVSDTLNKSARAHSIRGSARNFVKRFGPSMSFTCRELREDGVNIIRCWRVS